MPPESGWSRERVWAFVQLMRFDRPIGTLLVLWPTLWGLWLAGRGHPDPFIVLVFVAGVVVMRAAGCVINDYADREFDPHVSRTRERPLANGRIAPHEALWLFVILSLVAFGLVLLLNRFTLYLSLVAIALAASYPFMKRFTQLPQVHLGLAFAWAVPMAFAAITDAVPVIAWLLLIAVLLWTVAYDTMYAMVDREDDLKIGVKSSAILFGDADRFIVAIIQAATIVVLLIVGAQAGRGLWFNLGVVGAAALFAYQQMLIVRREPAACFKAFLNNNRVGMVVFAGLLVDYL